MTTLRQRARREERWAAESLARNGEPAMRLEFRDGTAFSEREGNFRELIRCLTPEHKQLCRSIYYEP